METIILGNSTPQIQWCCLFFDPSKDSIAYFPNEVYLCIFPNSFVELIKMPTHLREGPRDVVHQGRTLLSSFVFRLMLMSPSY
jgi:hypothetical protein